MKPLIDVKNMRLADEEEIARGTESKILMLRAGIAVAKHIPNGRTAIVCGSGNNAGDGYVIATELMKKGNHCTIILLSEKFSPDGSFYFEKCKREGVPYCKFDEKIDFSQYDNIVDCIFGTGFKGIPEGTYRDTIEKINSTKARKVSVDINSGLNGDNGLGEICIKSNLTVSVGTLKYGHFLGKAKDLIDRVINVDIGIPVNTNSYLVENSDFKEYYKERLNFSHKGNYGTVGLVGGCENYCGAIKLASSALAALRAGCGISRVIVEKSIVPLVAPCLLESTLFALSENSSELRFVFEEIDKAINGTVALAIGMGWGRDSKKRKILEHIITTYEYPMIIDADGLNILSEDIGILRNKKGRIIITPHVGEMSRLTHSPVSEIISDPIKTAKEFAKEHGIIVLLKGTSSIVTDGDKVYVVNRGAAGMATAGSGDVLSGIMVGVLGERHSDLLLSVAYATYLNGIAGELAQREQTDIAMVSSDTLHKIPSAVIYCRKSEG